MVITVLVQVVPSIKQLFYFENFLFWVANLVIDYTSTSHHSVMVKSIVSNVSFLSVSIQIIKFVNIYAVS